VRETEHDWSENTKFEQRGRPRSTGKTEKKVGKMDLGGGAMQKVRGGKRYREKRGLNCGEAEGWKDPEEGNRSKGDKSP